MVASELLVLCHAFGVVRVGDGHEEAEEDEIGVQDPIEGPVVEGATVEAFALPTLEIVVGADEQLIFGVFLVM